MAEIRGYCARLSRIIVLLFNTWITKRIFIAEELETIFILPFFSPTHKIPYIAGYLLTTDDEYSVYHDHIWAQRAQVQAVSDDHRSRGHGTNILGFHVTSPNSRIQNWEAYKIFTFIQGKIT